MVDRTNRILTPFLFVLFAAIAVMVLFPFYWMLVSSFKEIGKIFATPVDFIPRPFTVVSYGKLLGDTLYPRWYLNTIIITVSYTVLAVFFSSIGGFAFAKYQFKFRTPLFLIVLSSMMIPMHGILIPLFMVLVKLGWIDTYHGVIIPFAANPFGIFFVRQYALGIPDELMYAGRIDGCTEFEIYWKIMLPLLKAAMGVLIIYFAMICWNWFIWPLVVMRNAVRFPINVGLATFITQYEIRYDEVMAGALLCTIPLIVLFVTMQRQFVQGLTAGAVKQ